MNLQTSTPNPFKFELFAQTEVQLADNIRSVPLMIAADSARSHADSPSKTHSLAA